MKKKTLVILIGLLFVFFLNAFMYKVGASSDNYINRIITSNDFDLDLTNEEKIWLEENPVIRLGIDRAFPPFGSISEDYEYVGFSADIMNIIEYRLGFKFDIAKDAPWNKTMEMAKLGEVDMISALVNSKQRQQFLEFTPSYIKNPTIIINDGMSNGYIGSLKNLKGKTVAIERGSYIAGVISLEYPKIKLIPVKNSAMALSLVSIGKADAYVGNGVTSSYLIRQLGYNNLSYSGPTEYSSSHSIGITRSNKMLANVVNKALSSISKAEIEKIANYWFGMNTTQSAFNKNTAISITLALITLLIFLGFWTYSLRKTKNELKVSQSLIRAQAEIDHLTGLGNRRNFYKNLNKYIAQADEKYIPFALFYLDLDMFKEVNDRLGHAIGDLLLIYVSKRIISCLSDNVLVSRIGGDEFMVILPGISNQENINVSAERILKALSDVFTIKDNEIYITTSIGITCFPDDSVYAEQLVNNGDQAMYHSKKKGRNCFSYFNKMMKKEALYKASLIKDLHVAIEEKQFTLHYQPIVDFSNNTITKAESLIRWNHPERGLVSPGEFIPLAEEAGVINEIGEWTFKKAVDHVARLHGGFNENFQITINTSPLQYRKKGMKVSSWCEYLYSHGLSGKNVVVEITEGVLMETSKSTIDNLFQLRDLNIGVAIDDFGTGYSSLSYLKKFDIDYLKIDQSFVKNLSTDPGDIALVEAIIIMAHRLGLKVIAEGIETKVQKDILMEAGCDLGQGFYFSRPLDADGFIEFLEFWDEALLLKNEHKRTPLGFLSR